jgi:hypothetical protein
VEAKDNLDAAVEHIMGDPKYARQVYENPKEALKQHDLRSGEWRLVHWFLAQDVKDTFGQSPAISSIDFSAVKYKFLGRLPSFRGDVIAGPSDPTVH